MLLIAVIAIFGLTSYIHVQAQTQESNGTGFSLQVTPSPIIETIRPGERSAFELKVQNKNTVSETLKMELRAFSINKETGEIQISEETATNVADFVSFENEIFSVDSGQWYTQKVIVDTPKEAGFSYNFVVLISRQETAPAEQGVSKIEGSVAVFALLNTDRPGAVKKLELENFISLKKSYEYLPAEFELSIKNSGNTIVQPQGNIFLGRSGDEQQPLAVLKVNENDGYIIPDSSRKLKVQWNDGFPSRNEKGELVWDWSKLSNLRIGRYTAKAIVIYDDGERDIPLESSVTFWVIPWKLLSGLLILLLLVLIGGITVFRKSYGALNTKRKGKRTQAES